MKKIILFILFYFNFLNALENLIQNSKDVYFIPNSIELIELLMQTKKPKKVKKFIIYFKSEEAKKNFIKDNTYIEKEICYPINYKCFENDVVFHNINNLHIIGFKQKFYNINLEDKDKLSFFAIHPYYSSKEILDIISSDNYISAIEFFYE